MAKNKLDPTGLSGAQKAAIFLLAMGEDYSSQIFSKMSETEIQKIAMQMVDIDQIPADVLKVVMEEFTSEFQDESKIVVKGGSFIKKIVGKVLKKEQAESVMKHIEEKNREKPFAWARNVDTGTLGSLVQAEHPQTVALILANLPVDVASDVLATLPEEKKGDIALRIGSLGKVPDDLVRDIDKTLREEIMGMGAAGGMDLGGLEKLVKIIGGIDRASEEQILEFLDEESGDLANDVRGMMFVFEDLLKVDDRGMREILKRVESQQVVLSLKTATEEMKQKILGNLSSRAAEMILEDLEVMGPVKLSEVEASQQLFIQAAKELEAEGTIVLGGGKEDTLV
ncbi:MAG: flagellar motor switch protein FliG [Desulfobacterales bacterium]|nr:flagellar motor switch protein FliG [Desulfobacterales bacterium]